MVYPKLCIYYEEIVLILCFIINLKPGLCFLNSSFELPRFEAAHTISRWTSLDTPIRPELILFDLDKTIWPFYVDSEVVLPIKKTEKGLVLDGAGNEIKLYPQIPALFQELHKRGHILGIISPSPDKKLIETLLEYLGISKYLTFQEICPGPKANLVERISEKSEIDLGEILYLEDEWQEVGDVAALTTVVILIENDSTGVTMHDIEKGLHIFSTEAPQPVYEDDDYSLLERKF